MISQIEEYFNTIKGLKGFSGLNWDFDFLNYLYGIITFTTYKIRIAKNPAC